MGVSYWFTLELQIYCTARDLTESNFYIISYPLSDTMIAVLSDMQK